MDQIEEATQLAEQKNKALAFVYTDETSTWGPCNASSLEAFKQLKKHAVVVYVNTKKLEARESLSPVVMGALHAESMGNIIPKAVVTSPDQRTYMTSIAYKSMKEKKTFRDANKQVKAALAGNSIEMPKDAIMSWSLSGKNGFHKGEFVKLQDDKTLIIKSPERGDYAIPMEKLSKGAQAYARLLAGGGKEEAATSTTSDDQHALESWTNASGKQIQAKFLALENGKISLEMKNGKVVAFDLTKLSKDSQQRARELAGE